MVNINRLTEKAREALISAQELAEGDNHNEVAPEHLLASLLQQDGGVIPELVRKLNIAPQQLLAAVQRELERRPKVYGGAQVTLSSELSRVMSAADKEAQQLKDEFISTEHLLLALLDARQ